MANEYDSPENFDFATEEELAKLAYQRALKRQAEPAPGIATYGRNINVLPGWGQVLSHAANQYRGGQDEEAAIAALRGIGQRKIAAQREFLAGMPNAYEEKQTEIAGPPEAGQEGQSLGTQTSQVEKSPLQQAREWQQFGAKGMLVPGMEKIGAYGLEKAISMPEKIAEREQKALDRQAELEARLNAQKELAAEKAAAAASRQEQTNLLRQQNIDIARGHLKVAEGEEQRKVEAAKAKTEAAAAEAEANTANLNDALVDIASKYQKLNENRDIVSTKRGGLSNALSALQTSSLGQATGRVFGTESQSLREEIKSARQQLLMMIAKKLNVKASQLNSNVELKNWMDALSDPSIGYDASMAILQKLQDRYVNGNNVQRDIDLATGKITQEEFAASAPKGETVAPTAPKGPPPTGPAYNPGKSSVLPQSRLTKAGSSISNPVTVRSQAERDALPPGTYYVDPKGNPGRTPG